MRHTSEAQHCSLHDDWAEGMGFGIGVHVICGEKFDAEDGNSSAP